MMCTRLDKKYGENQTGTEPGTLIENSPYRHYMVICDILGLLNQNMSKSFSHNSKFYS